MTRIESKATTLPLSVLVHDEAANAGHEKRLTQIDDLIASIPVHGVIQSLLVRPIKVPGKGSKMHAVTAGNRRLAALFRLRDQGAIGADYPVPVIIRKGDDKSAHELSAAENIQRLPMSPVEEFRAFARMRSDGLSDDDVALHFGIPVRRVQQRQALAALHPGVLAALEAGRIGLESAQAFTLSADPERQLAYLEEARDFPWKLQSGQVRQAMTRDAVPGSSAEARLVGEADYLAAGGEIVRDLFGDADSWVSPDVLTRLVTARWQERIDGWLADGWSFVCSTDEFGRSEYGSELVHQARRLHPEVRALEAADDKELRDAGERLGVLKDQFDFDAGALDDDEDENDWGDDEDEGDDSDGEPEQLPPPTPEAEAEYRRLVDRADALNAKKRAFTAEQKALSGVVYRPADGSVLFGVIKIGDEKRVDAEGREKQPPEPVKIDLDLPGDTVLGLCGEWLTAALRHKVGGDARLALNVLVATLHTDMRAGGYAPTHLKGGHMQKSEGDPPQGATYSGALAWAAKQDLDDLLVYLAQLMALNIDFRSGGPGSREARKALLEFVDPDPLPQFDAVAYFDGLRKPQIQFAYKLMTGLDLKDGKKGEMVATAAARARELGWLPPQLRTPGYVVKGVTAAPGEPEPDADAEQLQAAE